MADDNNNGLFNKIKKTVTNSKPKDFVGQKNDPESITWFEQSLDGIAVQKELNAALEQEFKHRFGLEKQQLSEVLERKFAQQSREQIIAHEQKFKQLFALEKEKYQRFIKQKYEEVAKRLLKQHENTLVQKHALESQRLQSENAEKISSLQRQFEVEKSQQHLQIVRLEQEIEQQKKLFDVQLEEAKIAARQEQERLSKSLYDNLLQANQNEIFRQAEEQYKQQLIQHEKHLLQDHSENLNQLKSQLLIEYEKKLQQALSMQQHKLQHEAEEIYQKREIIFNEALEQEVTNAVLDATNKLQTEFAKERAQLNEIIENMRPDIEANIQRLRQEIEDTVRVEFEWKLNQYKEECDHSRNMQLQELLTVEKQKLAEELQQENQIILKYKEREIRDICEAEKIQVKHQLESQHDLEINESRNKYEQQIQSVEARYAKELQDLLATQEARLQQDAAQQLSRELEQLTVQLTAKHEERLHDAVISERARLLQQSTTEKKILLQQQQQNLELKFAQELAAKLSEQEIQLAGINQNVIQDNYPQSKIEHEQELRAELAQHNAQQLQQQEAKLRAEFAQELALLKQQISTISPSTAGNVFTQELLQSEMMLKFAHEKSEALEQQRIELTNKFEQALQASQELWHKKQQEAVDRATSEAIVTCEHDLRVEFQALLDQQRAQDTEYYAKTKDQTVRDAMDKLKFKLIQDIRAQQIEEMASLEDQIKEQYANKLQQQLHTIRADFAKAKQDLLDNQQRHLDDALEQQKEELREEYRIKFAQLHQEHEQKNAALLEQERKKINLKFAQDKANLIQEISAKFAQEKQIALNKYETELRDSLYREMVKQKEYVQQKFANSQEIALQEQKRRLEAQHKQEIERIKQGFFDPKHPQDLPGAIMGARNRHNQVLVSRGVEQLADQILSKFNK